MPSDIVLLLVCPNICTLLIYRMCEPHTTSGRVPRDQSRARFCTVRPRGAKACSVLLLHRKGQQLTLNPDSGIFLETERTNKSRREEADELVSSRPTTLEGERGKIPLCLQQEPPPSTCKDCMIWKGLQCIPALLEGWDMPGQNSTAYLQNIWYLVLET